jgi:hypothetical protein
MSSWLGAPLSNAYVFTPWWLVKYKDNFTFTFLSHLPVAVQQVRWDEGGSQSADEYTFSYGNGNFRGQAFPYVRKSSQELRR